MTKITYIPSEIANAAIDEHGNRKPVTRTHHIFDDNKNKNQAEVNIDIDNSLNQLSNEIDAVNKQDVISVDALPDVSTADPKKIYRVVGDDSYTDYMVNASGDDWKKLATYSFPGIDNEPTVGSNNLVKSGGVANKISELERKTKDISKEIIETKDENIVVEDNNGNEIFHLDDNGLNAKNIKSNGKDVLTEHQDISKLATKDEVEKAKINEISSETTEKTDSAVIIATDDDKPVSEMHAKISDDNEEVEAWTSDDYDDEGHGETYAKITQKGISAKEFFYMDGKPISRTRTWKDKKIIWFGTSIPAQGYPLNCGLALQANVINEAKGSSMARIGNIANAEPTNPLGDVYGVKNYAWQNIAYSLSMTQEEKHDIFLNWNTEKRKANLIAQGYTSEEVVNVKGYGELMGGSFGPEDTDPTQHDPKDKPTDIMNEQYTEFRKKCYATCWNNSTDIETGFGIIEGKIEKYMNLSDKPALWVLDHSNNDLSANQDTFPDDVFDRHYYIGAINFLIDKIFSFDPRARILLVANYCNDASNYKRMEDAIKKIADYWQLPLFLPSSVFGFSAERKVTTNAYWDKSMVWHDSGFDGTNGYGGDSNIRQLSDGTWVHDISLLNAWMADKIHPSSDKTKDYYGKMIAKFIDNNLN